MQQPFQNQSEARGDAIKLSDVIIRSSDVRVKLLDVIDQAFGAKHIAVGHCVNVKNVITLPSDVI